MTSQQDRLYETFYQLVKSQWNFFKYTAIDAIIVYIQIHMDFDIKHFC